MFKELDLDGNGTIDFEEFKAGAKKAPLLVKAFLAPVQQGSLATTPAAARTATSCEASGPVAASCEEGASHRASETTTEAPEDAAAPTEQTGSCSDMPAAKDGVVGCDDDDKVDGRDNVNAKRSRVEGSGPDCEAQR